MAKREVAPVVERGWYRPREVAVFTGLSEAEIYKAIHRGDLRSIRYRRNVIMVPKEAMAEWIAQSFVPYTPKTTPPDLLE